MTDNAIVPYSMSDIERMGTAMAKSGLFGVKQPEQAIALMLLAQAEGKHPAIIGRDYDVIQGRPAKKSEAMLRDFLGGGGKVEWHALSDTLADATFSHPAGGTLRITWDMERAKRAELGGKDMWRKYPRQMLRARVISEGVRAVGPFATSGLYVPEEVRDFEPQRGHTIDAEPQAPEGFEDWRATLEQKAAEGTAALQVVWDSGTKEFRRLAVKGDWWPGLKARAEKVFNGAAHADH